VDYINLSHNPKNYTYFEYLASFRVPGISGKVAITDYDSFFLVVWPHMNPLLL